MPQQRVIHRAYYAPPKDGLMVLVVGVFYGKFDFVVEFETVEGQPVFDVAYQAAFLHKYTFVSMKRGE